MINELIRHQWKESARSKRRSESTGVKIAYWFFLVLILFYVLAFGLAASLLIKEFYPDQNSISVYGSFVLYYLGMDLFMRFYLQDLPVLSIGPYLHLPIKKSKMIHFMLAKSVLSAFNLLPVFLIIPFMFMDVIPTYGGISGLVWLIFLYGLVINNNFVAIYFKRQMVGNIKIVIGLILVFGGLVLLDYLQIFSISGISSSLILYVLEQPIVIAAIPVLIGLTYFINFYFLSNRAYIEEISIKKQSNANANFDTSFLNKFGQIGQLIQLEVKLILRNKRPKSMLVISVIFLLYGLIFYTQDIYHDGFGMFTFVGIFMTGIFMSNYGQLLLSWNSNFFDKVISSNINIKTYYESKFWLFLVTAVVSYILTIPYVFFGWKILAINTACFIYNIGINIYVTIFFGMRNPKRINLDKGATFNYEGITATQFILMIPILLVPPIVVVLADLFWSGYWGLAVLSIMGVLGLIFREQVFNWLYNRFLSKKYEIATGLRKE